MLFPVNNLSYLYTSYSPVGNYLQQQSIPLLNMDDIYYKREQKRISLRILLLFYFLGLAYSPGLCVSKYLYNSLRVDVIPIRVYCIPAVNTLIWVSTNIHVWVSTYSYER